MQKPVSNSVLYLMSISAGLFVANLYYSQPLLNLIAESFHVNESAVSNVPLFTQLGYAAGLLLIVPLGDMVSNMRILKIDFMVLVLSLLVAAIAKSLWILIGSSFVIGATSSIPQLFVPMAAELSDESNRGRAIGVVMTGLLIGIIGSRVISGLVGEQFGWRTMYYVAAIIMTLLFIALYFKLPRMHPSYKGSYGGLMKSLWTLAKNAPALRLAAVRGALAFAGLSAMWTTIVFLLQDSFGYGSGVAGIFGLLGIAGALGSTVVGKLNDRVNKDKMILASVIMLVFSWILFLFSAHFITGLIIGVVFVDLGQQTLHVTNQDIILRKTTGARNRINTVYMVTFFIGGAIGTALGALTYTHFNWTGVSVLGLLFSLLVAIVHYIFRAKK